MCSILSQMATVIITYIFCNNNSIGLQFNTVETHLSVSLLQQKIVIAGEDDHILATSIQKYRVHTEE